MWPHHRSERSVQKQLKQCDESLSLFFSLDQSSTCASSGKDSAYQRQEVSRCVGGYGRSVEQWAAPLLIQDIDTFALETINTIGGEGAATSKPGKTGEFPYRANWPLGSAQ